MAYNPCDPCCNTGISFSSNETARYSIGTLLCQILGALEGGSSTDALAPVSAHIPFGSVTTGWVTALVLSTDVGILRFYNTTNRDIQVSFDGGTNYLTVGAGVQLFLDLASNNLHVNTDVAIRAVTAAPVSGEFEIFGSTVNGNTHVLAPTSAHYPFASITTSFTVALVNTAAIRYMRINNATNQPLQISFDGGTNYFTIKAAAAEIYNWADNNLHVDTSVSVRAVVAPISGELEIYGGV